MAKKSKKTTKKAAKKVMKKTVKKAVKKASAKMAKKPMKAAKKATKKTTAKTTTKKTALKAKPTKSKKSYVSLMKDYLKGHSNPIRDELQGKDPSKSPGHRNINVMENSMANENTAMADQSTQAREQLSRADKITRAKTAQRRVITGAAVGKTGRIVSK